MLYYRRQFILGLLEKLGNQCTSIDFQKLLFLACQKQEKPTYSFIPYKYGCFSFESYADRRALVAKSILKNNENWLLKSGSKYFNELTETDQQIIEEITKDFKSFRGDKLLRYVYLNYPYYAQRSEVINSVLTPTERKKILNKTTNKTAVVYTLGYEGLSLDGYLNKLITTNVNLLCDVRKNPLSRKYGFSKLQLKDALNKIGVQYMHFPELGIPSEERRELNSVDDYQKLFKKYEKTTLKTEKEAINSLLNLLNENSRIALTCFEADHKCCHRSRVANALVNHKDWSAELEHI